MALNPIDILKDKVENTTHTVTIDSVVSLGGGLYQLNSEYTYYLRTLKKVTIDAVKYEITDFVINSYITVQATSGNDVPVVATSFTINPPLFKWGSPKLVSNELIKATTKGDYIWPYIWVVRIDQTKGVLDPASATPETPSFNMLFLDSANKQDWTIEDHYEQDIYTLNNYIDFFFTILRTYRDLFDYDSVEYTKTEHVNFGDYIVDEGNNANILNDKVTGIQLQIDIPLTITACNKLQINRL